MPSRKQSVIKARTNRAKYMSNDAFDDLKKALEAALAWERGKRRLHVTRIQVPRGGRGYGPR
ncbi:MAG: hypothetical protein ACR2H4_06835 [Pyrinomonadaceae bacterium]